MGNDKRSLLAKRKVKTMIQSQVFTRLLKSQHPHLKTEKIKKSDRKMSTNARRLENQT